MTSMHKTYSSVEVVDEEDQEVEDLETDQEVVDSDDEVEVLVEVVTELDLDLVEVIEVEIEVAETMLLAAEMEDIVVPEIILSLDTTIPIVDEHLLEGNV